MQKFQRSTAVFVALCIVLSITAYPISAGAFSKDQYIGFGKVTEAVSLNIDGGIVYDEMSVIDDDDNKQMVRTFTFDPTEGDVIPLVYCKFSGYGATTYDSALAAEAEGYDVKGAVNGAFFGLTGVNANIYGGVCISNGRILQGCNDHGEEWVLAFNSDGSCALVRSKVEYSVSANGGEWTAPVVCLNVCPQDTYDIIYYYDSLCGSVTDTKATGVEIVFDKLDGGELTVGGVLKGRVCEVRYSVSEGGAVGKDQFVLYAPHGGADAESLRSLNIGDTVEINVRETVSESREVMENCSSAIVTYGYHIVSDGVNVTDSDGLGDSYNNTRGPRTGLGIKADGSMVIVSANGRTEEHPGLTVYELSDMLISMGCVTGINLDGGYSSQMVIENKNGVIESKTEQLRRVTNSILLVKHPGISDDVRLEAEEYLKGAVKILKACELEGDASALQTAADRLQGVLMSKSSMDGDCTKAIMELCEALSNVSVLSYRTGVYHFDAPVTLYRDAFSDDVLYKTQEATSFTVTEASGNMGFTKYLGYYGWIELSGIVDFDVSCKNEADITLPTSLSPGEALNVSWTSAAGASAYSYEILEFAGTPGSEYETDVKVLAQGWTTDTTSVKIPALERRDGMCIKVSVGVEYPDGTVWSEKYVKTSYLPFVDVKADHWGYNGIAYSYGKGFFNGVTGTQFDPTGSMTRAMMATVIYRMAGSPAVDSDYKTSFTDIRKGAWYYNGVIWCESNGIVTGTSKTTFDPTGIVTREQTACFLYRYANYKVYDVSIEDDAVMDAFSDTSKIGKYAEAAVQWTVQNEIMKGSGGKLSPKDTADRVQIATLIYNFGSIFEAEE